MAINWQKLQNGSDIRGVAIAGVADEEVNLTPEIVKILGQAFATWLSQRQNRPTSSLVISVGRDSRLSGPVLMDSIVDGINALGSQVYDFAIASTPAMFMSTITEGLNCNGAIMVTASHLPFNRNGLKFFTAQGGLEKKDITDILKLAENLVASSTAIEQDEYIILCDRTKPYGNRINYDFISVYANQLVDKIRAGVNHPHHYDRPLQGLRIIVDAGNGAGGFYVSKVLAPLGADTTGSQFLEPDGTFPNHVPNPEDQAAMAAICGAVIRNQADFGIIFDTDVDRSGAVDQSGKELNRNRLIALIAAIILQEHPGSTIVTDSITSDGLAKFITEDLGGVHHRFKRGYKNVINEAMRLNQIGQASWLAIETSGHGALRENHFLDDGAYLVSKLLIELAKAKLAGKSLTDLIANLQEPRESQELRLKIKGTNFLETGDRVLQQLTDFAVTQADWQIVPNNYEGVRVACRDASEQGWFLLRMSLHDPVMPLNLESNVQGGIANMRQRLLEFIAQIPELELPNLNAS